MSFLASEFLLKYKNQFNFSPTNKQGECLTKLSEFITNDTRFSVFILTGYAGTGKTTLISHLVQTLNEYKRRTILLAPTGRAAKVFSSYAGQAAFTIHKKIYRKQKIDNGSIQLALAPNLSKNAIVIVDEASMIADYQLREGTVSERNLLEDLLNYTFSQDGCKLILVGDEGQLPPVGSNFSPALSKDYLQHFFPHLSITIGKLTEVVRQAENSDILKNATALRSKPLDQFRFKIGKNSAMKLLDGLSLQEELERAYAYSGTDETIIITKSNKRAVIYNQEIRKRILFHEDELSSGDLLMCVKNSYHWIEETSEAGFIANGEILRVKRLFRQEELYGFRFQHVELELVDYPSMGSFNCILLLDTLTSESPNLPRDAQKQLFFEVEKDYADERSKKIRYEKILADPYFNALQVKFAYAVTCHKAQGGQWEQVFLDHGYVDEQFDESFNRWLYTAVTRAKEKLFLINVDERLRE